MTRERVTEYLTKISYFDIFHPVSQVSLVKRREIFIKPPTFRKYRQKNTYLHAWGAGFRPIKTFIFKNTCPLKLFPNPQSLETMDSLTFLLGYRTSRARRLELEFAPYFGPRGRVKMIFIITSELNILTSAIFPVLRGEKRLLVKNWLPLGRCSPSP